MRIGLDAHAIGSKLGGNETYIARLISELGEVAPQHQFVAYFGSGAAAEPWNNRHENVEVRVLPAKTRYSRLLRLPGECLRDGVELLHVQYVSPPASKIPTVVTVHDISFKLFPEWFEGLSAIALRIGVAKSLACAAGVITISHAATEDLLRHYGISPNRVAMTHLGVDWERFGSRASPDSLKAALQRQNIEGPYLLAVGNLQPRKNLARLVEAFAIIKKTAPDVPHKLVLVGMQLQSAPVLERQIRDLNLQDRVILTGYLTEDDLVIHYQGAAAFVYPSLYEGFGLPVLEAMSAGTPVIASNQATLREVAGDNAVFVNPLSPASIAAGILEVVRNYELAQDLSARGLMHARKFSWEKTARQTVMFYESLLGVSP